MEKKGMSLLEKSKSGILRVVFSRIGLVICLLLLQIFWIFSLFKWFSQEFSNYALFVVIFDIIMVLYLVNSNIDPSAKMTWLLLITLAPLLGSCLLLYTQRDIGHRALHKRILDLIKQSKENLKEDKKALEQLAIENPSLGGLAYYLRNCNERFPVYCNSKVKYFPSGETKFNEMLIELKKAQHFIFVEYFIIAEGEMWGKILEVLAQKAAEGVEVRVMYDGMCEFTTLTNDYPKRLEKLGINCKMFSPIRPFVSTYYNYRDHRKILVIDGEVAFTGGVNLADEYINRIERFGHWKDTAVMVRGEAVKTFTQLFLQMWNITESNAEFLKYMQIQPQKLQNSSGYIIPYADVPLEEDKVSENVYMDILNGAKKYVHIMTPYLILDGKMEHALIFAAKRGVDVELILPGIPDKKIPYALAKTHFKNLISAGVKIYLYTPGFIHAKSFVSDNTTAIAGTVNLDYRSLYHHFECALLMYMSDCVEQIERDFIDTRNSSEKVTLETLKQEKISIKLIGICAKTIAPLL